MTIKYTSVIQSLLCDYVLQTSGRITLKHQSTTDPDLVEWSGTKMTVMPSSGDLLVWGQAKKKLGSSKVAFHIIR